MASYRYYQHAAPPIGEEEGLTDGGAGAMVDANDVYIIGTTFTRHGEDVFLLYRSFTHGGIKKKLLVLSIPLHKLS